MANKRELNVDLFAYAKNEGARVLKAPLNVWDDEVSFSGAVGSIDMDLHRDSEWMWFAVEGKGTCDLDDRISSLNDGALIAGWDKGHLGKMRGIQDFCRHFVVTSFTSAIAAAGGHDYRSRDGASISIEVNRAALHVKGSVNRVEDISESKGNIA
jgi:hypothetical protein